MTIVSARMTWDQARGMSQHRARKCYERMLGLRYTEFKYSNALEYLDSLTKVVPALHDFEEDEKTDQDKTMVGILMQERRPGKVTAQNLPEPVDTSWGKIIRKSTWGERL